MLRASGIEPARASVRSPWQNGTAERWVGSARRECFDHVIVLNDPHERRVAITKTAPTSGSARTLGFADPSSRSPTTPAWTRCGGSADCIIGTSGRQQPEPSLRLTAAGAQPAVCRDVAFRSRDGAFSARLQSSLVCRPTRLIRVPSGHPGGFRLTTDVVSRLNQCEVVFIKSDHPRRGSTSPYRSFSPRRAP
jgi:hypothetical protein